MFAGTNGEIDFANLIPFILFILTFLMIGITAVIIDSREKKRVKDIQDYCNKNNIKYSEHVSNFPKIAYTFSLLKHNGFSSSCRVVMSGNQGDFEYKIFDFCYLTRGNKGHVNEHYSTICILTNSKAEIPKFFLREENFIGDSLGKLFGGQDINFSEDSTFSKMFVLQGTSETLIRKFFNNRVRNAFVSNHSKGYKYEGYKNSFMIRISDRQSLENRLNILSKSMNIFKEMVSDSDKPLV